MVWWFGSADLQNKPDNVIRGEYNCLWSCPVNNFYMHLFFFIIDLYFVVM